MMKKTYTPNRGDIIYLDFEPVKGKEVGKYRPALVLSSKEYNFKTKLLICCPISTSIRNTPTEVSISGLDKPSVVASSIVQTLSWPERKVKFVANASDTVVSDVLARLLPLIGAEAFI